MEALMLGGKYDGMTVDHAQVKEHLENKFKQSKDGRKFYLFPEDVTEWQQVLDGEKSMNDVKEVRAYELKRMAGGVSEFHEATKEFHRVMMPGKSAS